MTDRTLLRLSAIACGELIGEWKNNEAYFDGVLSRWNPLEDSGDALRLATYPRFTIKITDHEIGITHHSNFDQIYPKITLPKHRLSFG